ncbi:helix-turn-helix domain-containing protein [Streptomyces sp. R33]|uniref:Helix-turn-helix domain-containing protein n=1 Tax=Streptomyces sp. R33 TaxID=3238629 RepID=A0AB39YEH5_9ACTN
MRCVKGHRLRGVAALHAPPAPLDRRGRLGAPGRVFAHPLAGSPESYVRVLGCHVAFDARENAITVANEDLDRRRPPVRSGAQRPAPGLRRPAPAPAVRGRHVAERVGQRLEHAALAGAGHEAPAKELNLSVRTLRRALHTEGTAWRALLDAARHGRTRRLLETTALPLDRIAPLSGLSGATALVRASHGGRACLPGRTATGTGPRLRIAAGPTAGEERSPPSGAGRPP